MKVLTVFVLTVCWCGRGTARPLIADVLKAVNGGNGRGTGMDPLYEEANYRFQYEVKDPESGNDFGHMEARMGDVATGSYHAMLPDGRVQRVDYVADQEGFKPMISYEGEAMYGPGVGVNMGAPGAVEGGVGDILSEDIRASYYS